MAARIPVTIVTGFLGSGKTTLIAHLLTHEAMANALVIVNEFGEVGIDHDLLEASSDDVVLLANGCLCCTIRGNLVDTLADVAAQRESGRLRAFDRVIVETSGVADPAPLLAFLYADAATMARYRIESVVTVCDALAAPDAVALTREAESQIRVADLIVMSKGELAGDARTETVERRLRALNPDAPIHHAARGAIDPGLLRPDVGDHNEAARPRKIFICDDASPGHVHDETCLHGGAPGHGGRFRATVLRATRPLRADEPDALLAAIRTHASPTLLRLKGFLPVEGRTDALVVQAALTAVHEPEWRDGFAGEGRLVAISEGEPPAALVAALARFGIERTG